jgi:hypothetical protein
MMMRERKKEVSERGTQRIKRPNDTERVVTVRSSLKERIITPYAVGKDGESSTIFSILFCNDNFRKRIQQQHT